MRKIEVFILVVMLVIPAAFLFAPAASSSDKQVLNEPIVFPRYPDPSPDGKTLAFCYDGDVWTVPIDGGSAQRVTVHPAYEYRPLWSPDGEEIAFSSTRYVNSDIFVIPKEGGVPDRLTYFSNFDRLCDWTPDGEELIFYSYRDSSAPPDLPSLYSVKREGGTPTKLIQTYGFEGKISPDGRHLAFARGDLWRSAWWYKDYRGSANKDIYTYNFETDEYARLTDHEGNDCYPMWFDNDTLYYVSDEDGTFNIWKMSIDGENKTQITFHEEDGVRFPQISRNGNTIAYERGFDIWILSTETGANQKIDIYAPTDYKSNPVERSVVVYGANEFKVSPDETQIAFVIRGEIFVTDIHGDETRKLTDNPSNDCEVSWSPDGKILLFSSDRNGNYDIFSITSETDDPLCSSLKNRMVQLTDSEKDEEWPEFSPDGKHISYVDDTGLHMMDPDGKHEKSIFETWSLFNWVEYSWSPDSSWIAVTKWDDNGYKDIFMVSINGKKSVDITNDPHDCYTPLWSMDGKGLAFVSNKADITYSRLASTDIWYVSLQGEEHKNEESESESEEKIEIDFDGIEDRAERITYMPGNESSLAFSPDSQTLAFSATKDGKSRDLWIVNCGGSGLTQLTRGGVSPHNIQWNSKGNRIYYLDRNNIINVIDLRVGAPSMVFFTAKLTIDKNAERIEIFNEAWGLLNNYFYDPNFHGVDWQGMKEKYEEIVSEVPDRTDFYDVIKLMIGELDASHLGVYPSSDSSNVQTGVLGLIFESQDGKGLKIKEVLPGGPCDKPDTKVKPGETLVSIDGVKIDENTNIYEILNDKVGERVLIEIKGKTTREIEVTPTDYYECLDLVFENWVKENRAEVKRLSNGKLGYVFIGAMSTSDLGKFQKEIYSLGKDKKGLVIDVRNNNGGWISEYLLNMLSRETYGTSIPRGGKRTAQSDSSPFYTWNKPIIVLCNQYSVSNAEMFSHAIKFSGRGKIVGVPTPGAVIGTYTGPFLIDDSYFRVPAWGHYTQDGLNMENHGCIPDFVIENSPGDEADGSDRQLKIAVQMLMGEI